MKLSSVLGAVTAAACTTGLALAPVAAEGASGCGYSAGYYVKVNAYTSCGFARNVARGFANGSYRPRAYSPSTGRYYTMNCRGSRRSAYCTGGNHAFVSLSR